MKCFYVNFHILNFHISEHISGEHPKKLLISTKQTQAQDRKAVVTKTIIIIYAYGCSIDKQYSVIKDFAKFLLFFSYFPQLFPPIMLLLYLLELEEINLIKSLLLLFHFFSFDYYRMYSLLFLALSAFSRLKPLSPTLQTMHLRLFKYREMNNNTRWFCDDDSWQLRSWQSILSPCYPLSNDHVDGRITPLCQSFHS